VVGSQHLWEVYSAGGKAEGREGDLTLAHRRAASAIPSTMASCFQTPPCFVQRQKHRSS